MKLSEILSDLSMLISKIEEEGIEGLEDTLESLFLELENKVNSYYYIVRKLKQSNKFYEEVIDTYKKRLEKNKNSISYLLDCIKHIHKEYGINRIKDENDIPLFEIEIKSSESILVEDASLLPNEYIREKHIIEPDKVKIKDAIKKGILFEDENVKIVRSENLQIKLSK